MTSLSNELGREITIEEVLPVAEKHLRDILENAELAPASSSSRSSSRGPRPRRSTGQ